jgi:F-type H+-transporting ATPase subunit c
MKKKFGFFLSTAAFSIFAAAPALAESAEASLSAGGGKIWFFVAIAIASAFGMAIAAAGTGLAQGNAVRGAVEGIARNPGASGKILSTLLIGLAMIESLAIYALVIALILLFANPFLKLIG